MTQKEDARRDELAVTSGRLLFYGKLNSILLVCFLAVMGYVMNKDQNQDDNITTLKVENAEIKKDIINAINDARHTHDKLFTNGSILQNRINAIECEVTAMKNAKKKPYSQIQVYDSSNMAILPKTDLTAQEQ